MVTKRRRTGEKEARDKTTLTSNIKSRTTAAANALVALLAGRAIVYFLAASEEELPEANT